jgi:hypothetical protein
MKTLYACMYVWLNAGYCLHCGSFEALWRLWFRFLKGGLGCGVLRHSLDLPDCLHWPFVHDYWNMVRMLHRCHVAGPGLVIVRDWGTCVRASEAVATSFITGYECKGSYRGVLSCMWWSYSPFNPWLHLPSLNHVRTCMVWYVICNWHLCTYVWLLQ